MKRRRFARAAALAAGLAALAMLSGIRELGTPAAPAALGETFSPDRLASLRAAGRPVFVNMTAAWCITCLVNERVTLSAPQVRDAFARGNVAYLRGDWTRQDPAITAFLRDHAHEGVPLYVFYPAGGGAPQVLPQILTAGALLDQLQGGA